VQRHYSLKFELCHEEREILVAFCVQQHHSLKFELCHQERETLDAFCVQQHHSLKLELCHQERKTVVAFCVQYHHSLKFKLCHQERKALVAFCVQQHPCLKFDLCHQEREASVAFCVQQHPCSNFGLYPLVREMLMFLLFGNIVNQDLCFSIRREGLSILFGCCKIGFQILFEETFSMLFNLSGCSCAENFCNLHAIIAILLIFLHKYLVFVTSPSSFIHVIV
jgi:hypothetical protein